MLTSSRTLHGYQVSKTLTFTSSSGKGFSLKAKTTGLFLGLELASLLTIIPAQLALANLSHYSLQKTVIHRHCCVPLTRPGLLPRVCNEPEPSPRLGTAGRAQVCPAQNRAGCRGRGGSPGRFEDGTTLPPSAGTAHQRGCGPSPPLERKRVNFQRVINPPPIHRACHCREQRCTFRKQNR